MNRGRRRAALLLLAILPCLRSCLSWTPAPETGVQTGSDDVDWATSFLVKSPSGVWEADVDSDGEGDLLVFIKSNGSANTSDLELYGAAGDFLLSTLVGTDVGVHASRSSPNLSYLAVWHRSLDRPLDSAFDEGDLYLIRLTKTHTLQIEEFHAMTRRAHE